MPTRQFVSPCVGFCRSAILILLTLGTVPTGRLFAVDDFRPLLEAAIRDGKPEVVIPPGVYRLAPIKGSTHVPVHGAQNLRIIADGVTLVCTKLTRAVDFDQCKNVTLRGLTVDYDPLPFTQGTVVRVADDASSIDVRLHAGYPREPYSRIDVCDPATRFRKRGMPFLWGTHAAMADEQTVRVMRADLGKTAAVGDLVSLSTGQEPGGAPHGVCVSGCEGMVFENVTVFSAPGFGIFEQSGEGGMRYTHCRVMPGPKPPGATEDRLLSSSWDAMQSSTVKRGPLVERCEIRDAGDDSWSVQSSDYLVVAADGPRAVIAFRDTYSAGPQVGDRLAKNLDAEPVVITAREGVSLDKAEMTDEARQKLRTAPAWSDWKVGPKALQIEYSGKTPLAVGDTVYCPDREGNGFIFRDNIVHSPGRILIKAGKGLIENNQVTDGHCGVTVCPELPGSGAAGIEDLVIRGNRFSGTGYFCPSWNTSQAGSVSITSTTGSKQFRAPGFFRNIVIENNCFDDICGPAIVAASTAGLHIAGNTFCHLMSVKPTDTGGAYGVDPGALIWLAQSQNVSVANNRVYEPGTFFKQPFVEKDADPAIQTQLRAGVQVFDGQPCPGSARGGH